MNRLMKIIILLFVFAFGSIYLLSCKNDGLILSVVSSPENKGMVSINPETETYNAGSEVSITAEPIQDYVFDSWYGDVESKDNPLNLTMETHTFIVGYFRRIKPVITITQDTTEINSDIDTHDFGQADNGSTEVNAVFTITNTGENGLRLIAEPPIKLRGDNVEDFSITQPDVTTLSEDESTTFTIHFTPKSSGTKSASVEIITNDVETPIFTFGLSAEALPAWHLVGHTTASNDFSYLVPSSLSVHDGKPYIAYTDGESSGGATVKMYDDDEWSSLGSSGFTIVPAGSISLAVGDGTPYVAYQDLAPTGNFMKASAMMYIGSWIVAGTHFSERLVYSTSLDVDDGVPYIAYAEKDNDNIFDTSNRATVMKKPSLLSGWEAVGTTKFSDGNVNSLNISVDNGTPYVVYQDAAHSDKATVMYYETSSWQPLGNAGFTTGTATTPRIQIDNGIPYVVFSDGNQSDKATVMYYESGSWQTLGNAGFSSGSASNTVISISNGVVYVAFSDGSESNKATVMYYDGDSWEIYGNKAGFSPSSVSIISLDTEVSGGSSEKVFIAYADSNNGSKATVMTYD